jgi:uncharacterized membrane protein (UPF0127 family)
MMICGVLSLGGCGAANGEEARAEPGRSGDPAATVTSEPTQQEGPGRGMAWVILGDDTVRAEVASTDDERRDGLMYREELPDGTGMLFVFPDEAMRSFWMANTYIPLDIAFLDSRSRIVDIKQMEPESRDLTESDAAAMYALEVRQGWLSERGIGVGLQAEIIFGPQ